MRLFELVRSIFHVSVAEKLSSGDIIERQDPAYPLGALLEGRLEALRPERCLPREKSFYLGCKAPGGAEYVYLVESIGQVDRHHTGWLKRLREASITSKGELHQYATGYWSGQELPELRDEPWEFRCLRVKILKRAGGTALMDDGMPFQLQSSHKHARDLRRQ